LEGISSFHLDHPYGDPASSGILEFMEGKPKVVNVVDTGDEFVFTDKGVTGPVTGGGLGTGVQAALALAANAANGVLQLDSSGDIPALPLDGVTNGSNAPAGSRHHGL
jgi:hypothetical protein